MYREYIFNKYVFNRYSINHVITLRRKLVYILDRITERIQIIIY